MATRSKVKATPRSYCRGCGFLLHNSSSSLPWAWGNKAPASRTRTRLANATTNSPHSRPLHVGAAREQNELIVVDPRARGGGVAQAAAVTTEGQPDAPPRAKTKTRRRHDDLPHAAGPIVGQPGTVWSARNPRAPSFVGSRSGVSLSHHRRSFFWSEPQCGTSKSRR